MSAKQKKRDLRTLLFCKLPTAANFQKLNELAAKQLPYAEGNDLWKIYYAFGGYNALCVYPISPVGRMNDDDLNWLGMVYEDKQTFAKNVTEVNLVCHQMHLISQNDYSEFWKEEENYPFFFVTLVYGVVRSGEEECAKANNEYCSYYERRVAQYLQKREKQEEIKTHCLFAIYNGINIGDVVILWKSNDIEKTLSLISELGYGNIARKTLTTIALPISPRGKLSPAVLNCLENGRADSELEILMRGTVKDAKRFDNFIQKIQNSMPNEDVPYALSLNPGKYDFTLSRRVTPQGLAEFVNGMLWQYDELIQKACWETHIDLLVPTRKLAEQEPKTTVLTPVITQLYKQFLEIYKHRMCQRHYSWWNSLLEQYCTQYYIDRHPTLHGPGYLVYQSLHILNGYLKDSLSNSREGKLASRVIAKSEESINHYISCLNLLMNQITHNDNAMISGYPNVHAILFSLPESILDFYHAFLRTVVEVLIHFDKLENRVLDNFEYDFLFTPQQGPRFRFCPVINADPALRDNENAAKVWPVRQAYVLEVPIKSLFEPMKIFPPMVHECFHCFGDELRKRKERKEYMGHFLATTIVTALNFGEANYTKVEQAVQKYLIGDGGTDEMKAPYLLEGVRQFDGQLKKLFSQTSSIDEVFERSNNTAYCLYTSDTLASFRNMTINYNSKKGQDLIPLSVLSACKYYFKECYADAMTIALLRLSPMEYLTLIKSELEFLADEESDSQNELAPGLAQRFAIVLAACNRSRLFDNWSINRIDDEIEQFRQEFNNQESNNQKFNKTNNTLFCYLKSYFNELVGKGDASEYFEVKADDGKTISLYNAAFPPAALDAVVRYLLECINELNDIPGRGKDLGGELDEEIQTLRSDFDQIIRSGDMFSQRFYELIYQQHQKIRDSVM